MLKKNSFLDYIDVAKYLIDHHYTRPDVLVGIGRSAGGLLMGGVHNLAPQLFRLIVADVPFVDVLNTVCSISFYLLLFIYLLI